MTDLKANAEKFSNSILEALKSSDCDQLEYLYRQLSEEEDISKAKTICSAICQQSLSTLIKVIKSKEDGCMLKYFAWHFLQLSTSCVQVKLKIQNDEELLPALMILHTNEFEDLHCTESLQTVSLNYLIVMLGGAANEYYDHVAASGIFTLIYTMLNSSSLSSNDTHIESIILSLNLLLEGTNACKKQFVALNFEKLLAKKIKDRNNCSIELLKVAQMTHQKLLLLSSENQSFVETFRKGFEEEAKKQAIYQEPKCFNKDCSLDYSPTFKRCSKCKIATYCSKECQIRHWKNGHSKICCPPPT